MHIDLVSAIVSKDAKERKIALEHFYEMVFEKIKTYVFRNGGNAQDAEDIFQDGLIAFYNNVSIGKFKKESKPETYLYSICKNIWLQKLRHLKRSAVSLDNSELSNESSEVSMELNSFIFNKIFHELSVDCQRILTEFYFKGRSIKDLKKSLGFNSDQVVKNKKGRCLTYLTQIIQKHKLSRDAFFE